MAHSIGPRIAFYRRQKGLTQEQFAEKLGVTGQAVSKWENDISCPDITLLPQIADFFGITVDELLRGDAQPVQMIPKEERKDLGKLLLKVRVDSNEGDIVIINLPLLLVKVGLEIGMHYPQISGIEALKDVDFGAILMMAESGVVGRLLDVRTAAGDVVEIVIE